MHRLRAAREELQCSQERAKSVVDYLISCGIESCRASVMGWGSKLAIMPNGDKYFSKADLFFSIDGNELSERPKDYEGSFASS